MGEVKQWPKPSGNVTSTRPRRIDKAADYGLLNCVKQMEFQWGTIEAYNRLVEHCERLRAKIDENKAAPPSSMVDNRWVRPPIPDHMKG